MNMKNEQIYNYALKLQKEYSNCNLCLPIKINFFLQKNIQTITNAAEEIENMKISIAKQYGTYNVETNKYDIPKESLEQVNKELTDLFTIVQDINIHTFRLEEFDGLELTYQQMNAILFMIEE